ncbi:MAG TPA: thiamine-phosphate kinase [Candidatus Angelobacter sp.]|nr:thiamine-phosphate kinase [Candidatus Angelobacter sp.]
MLPERKFIESVRKLGVAREGRELVRGIGDDCAVLQVPAGQQILITTDLCIEGVHFRREWHPPDSVGHRCLARGLSDIAAMGGEPVACFLSLGVPKRLSQQWVNGFLRGFLQLARQFKVPLAGGDTSSSQEITADIVVVGKVPSGTALMRSGARPGDQIYVTGELGYSAAVLKRLYAREKASKRTFSRYFYPVPCIEVGRVLRQKKWPTAMIDLSDGLSVDLAHICDESDASATVEAKMIPIAKEANLDLALHGGEDYELLFTVRPGIKLPEKIAGVRVTMIGRIEKKSSRGSPVKIRDRRGNRKTLKPKGWQHFSKN